MSCSCNTEQKAGDAKKKLSEDLISKPSSRLTGVPSRQLEELLISPLLAILDSYSKSLRDVNSEEETLYQVDGQSNDSTQKKDGADSNPNDGGRKIEDKDDTCELGKEAGFSA